MSRDRAPLPAALVQALQARFGARFSQSEAQRFQHGRSETHHEPHLPDGVVMAHSTDEVAAVVRHRAPVIPCGAGTSVEGNFTPIHGGITLNLSEMNRVLEVNAEDFDCTVQAGVRRTQLNEHLHN